MSNDHGIVFAHILYLCGHGSPTTNRRGLASGAMRLSYALLGYPAKLHTLYVDSSLVFKSMHMLQPPAFYRELVFVQVTSWALVRPEALKMSAWQWTRWVRRGSLHLGAKLRSLAASSVAGL